MWMYICMYLAVDISQADRLISTVASCGKISTTTPC